MTELNKKVTKWLIEYQNGDQKKFDVLMNNTIEHLTMVAKCYLVNKSYADDVVAETYVRGWKYISAYSREKSGYVWIIGILKNVVRRYNGKDAQLNETELTEEEPDLDADFSILAEQRTDLGRAVKRLDEESQRLVLYKFIFCYSDRDIACMMNMKRSTVNYKLHKIVENLKNFYKMLDKTPN